MEKQTLTGNDVLAAGCWQVLDLSVHFSGFREYLPAHSRHRADGVVAFELRTVLIDLGINFSPKEMDRYSVSCFLFRNKDRFFLSHYHSHIGSSTKSLPRTRSVRFLICASTSNCRIGCCASIPGSRCSTYVSIFSTKNCYVSTVFTRFWHVSTIST